MPGSHSKKDKLKKKVRKARTYRTKARKKPADITARKGLGRESDTRASELTEKITERRMKEDYERGGGMPKGKEVDVYAVEEYLEKLRMTPNRPDTEDPPAAMYSTKKNLQQWSKLKKKIAKIRKADQQDINRVKRWNSRSFNKKKELSGPTEKTFVPPKYPSVDLKGRPYPGMTGDELVASKKRMNVKHPFSQPTDTPVDLDTLQKELKGRKKIGYPPYNQKGEWVGFAKLRNRLAKIRKANGGIAPNYNNPSKVRKKKTATKAAAKSKSGYLGDASVNIPWGEEEVNITLRDMAQFHRKNMWTQKQGTYPQIWNLGPLTGEGQGARQIFDAAHDVENRFIEDMGEDNYQKNMQSEIDHLIKEYGEDPEGDLSFNEELTRTQDNLGLGGDVPQSRRNEIKRRQKKEKMARQRKALRSAVNKGVNKVNPIKPTKTYKKPPQGPNPDAQTPEAIRKNAEVIGRKNDTYIGKIKKKKKKYDLSKDDDIDVDVEREIARERMLERSQASAETQPQYGKTRKRIARIRKAVSRNDPNTALLKEVPFGKDKRRKSLREGEEETLKTILEVKPVQNQFLKRPGKGTQADRKRIIKAKISKIRKATEQIDPRVKKRKTVRPDSPVQKVSQIKYRIGEMKTAKNHNHSIAFRKHEGQYYKRASLQKQEGKYAKYWLLNAKQTNGNGWGVSPTSIAKNINKFIGRPFVITAKQWIGESEYGEQFEHPYLPTNNIDNIINHQEKFRVGSIVDVVEKDGDYHAVIEINSKFANMMLPPFCSPAIFQNNPGEADGEISDWEALHLAGLMEDPAYGARIALLKGSCMGTAEACSIQFKAAKQTTMCPKKKAKLVRRIDRLGD